MESVKGELQNNNLSGPFPDYISYLEDLQYLNLADNNFNGSIPDKWDELSNLKYLDLSSIGLTGRLPMQLFSTRTFSVVLASSGLALLNLKIKDSKSCRNILAPTVGPSGIPMKPRETRRAFGLDIATSDQYQRLNVNLFDAYFLRADLDRDGCIKGAEVVSFFQGFHIGTKVLSEVLLRQCLKLPNDDQLFHFGCGRTCKSSRRWRRARGGEEGACGAAAGSGEKQATLSFKLYPRNIGRLSELEFRSLERNSLEDISCGNVMTANLVTFGLIIIK
ncbi:hypothetical protein LR48_Vigan04g157100 [Vigna angularis]|uniref:EF-hand domain-containing protein n=1 Tax=Phaseolus angularis TaxID=3914 RepID=A0A0L9UF54_PHAAN|nr:hypothetical protein LR48_Vigan04g157100 [Vigna angularis]